MHSRPTENTTTPRRDWQTIGILMPYLWEYRARVIVAMGFLVLAKLAGVTVPLVLKGVVDALDSTHNAAVVLPLRYLLKAKLDCRNR